MGQDKFELFVNDKIGDYQSPIDSDELWAGIQAAQTGATAPVVTTISATTKFIVASVLILTLVGSGLWLLNSQSNDSEALNNTDLTSTLPANEPKPELGIIQTLEDESTSNVSAASEDKQNSSTVKESINNNTQQIENLAVVSTPIQASKFVSNAQNNSQNYNTTDYNATSQTSKANTVETSLQKTAPFTSNKPSNSENQENINNNNNNSDVAVERSANENSVSSKNTRLSIQDYKLKNQVFALNNNAQILPSNMPKPIACPDFGNRRGGSGSFGFELQAIPYYSQKRFTALDDLGREWQATRESTESYLESFQVNALLRYQHSSGIYAHAGIGYGQIDEKVQLDTEDFMDITVDTITIIVINTDGSRDTTRGPVMGTSETDLNAEVYNYHRMIELPFAIGYEFPVNNKIGIYADFGGSLNLAVFRQGYTVMDRTDLIPFDSTSRPVYKTSTGFKIKSSLGIRYYTSSGITLSAGPEIRYHTGNWLREELSLEQRYLDIGVRFAAGFSF